MTGRAVQPPSPSDRTPPRTERNKFFLTPLGILILTLTIAGPFTIPLVWKSPYMSRTAKWAFTIGILLFSIAVIWAFWMIIMFSIRMLADLDSATRI